MVQISLGMSPPSPVSDHFLIKGSHLSWTSILLQDSLTMVCFLANRV
jgi:hypothetical protein